MFHVKPPAPLEPDPAVTAVATRWAVSYVSRETSANHAAGAGVTQAHLVCLACDQSVVCLSLDSAGMGYVLTPGEFTARTIAHIRQRHEESVPVT